MSFKKFIIFTILSIGFIGVSHCCAPPSNGNSKETTKQSITFKNSVELAPDFTINYNDALDGKIRAQIKTKADAQLIGLGLLSLSNPVVLSTLTVNVASNTGLSNGKLQYISFSKDSSNTFVEFNFIICESGSKINFGTDLKYIPSAIASGVPSTTQVENADLTNFINNATC